MALIDKLASVFMLLAFMLAGISSAVSADPLRTADPPQNGQEPEKIICSSGARQLRTVIFAVSDAKFANRLTGSTDFHLDSQNPADNANDGNEWITMAEVEKLVAMADTPTRTPTATETATATPTATYTPTPTRSAMGQGIDVLRADGSPFLDGSVSEWTGLPVIPLNADNASRIEGERPSSADLSAELRVVWSPEKLYFAAVISDEMLIENDSTNLWGDDILELGIHVTGGRSHQFSIAVDDRVADQGTLISTLTVARHKMPGGWSLEVAVPNSVLDISSFAAGQTYAFTFALWDDDLDHGGGGQTHLLWQGTSSYSYQPEWGILRLGAGSFTFDPTPTWTPTPTSSTTATATWTPTPTRTRTPTQGVRRVFLPLLLGQSPSAPSVPVLNPITPPEANPSYTVRWSTAARAESYVLERATDSNFEGAVQVYAGPAIEHMAASAGIATHHFRVKALNASGESGWSNVQAVEVRWEAEPNDLWDKGANGPLASGKNYYGYPNDSSDYYYLVVPTDGQIVLDLKGHSGQGVQTLVYYGPPPQDTNSQVCHGSPDCHLTFSGKRGTYYIKIYVESGFNQSLPYMLRVTFP